MPWLVALFVLAGLTLVACTQATPPSPTTEVKTPAAKTSASAVKASWEETWDRVLAEAKKEGAVTIYTIWMPKVRTVLTQAFKEKYGINLEFSPFGRGADLLAKVKAEKAAGLNIADVFGAGNTSLIFTMKPEGLLGPIEPLLILPEVLDRNAWRGGKLPFADKEGTAFSMVGLVIRSIVYNTDLVKEGEITSFKDLLKPQYKGKITFGDPSVTGIGNALLYHLGDNLWGEAEATNFFRRLIKEQDVVIQRDNRLHVETVARGKYAIGLAPETAALAEFIELGAPVKVAMVGEDNRMSTAAGALGVATKFAHPNATIIFVNWLLSKEGQSFFAKSFGNPSTRLDVSTEGIDPLFIPRTGEKYYMETEEALAARGRWLEISKKVLDEASR